MVSYSPDPPPAQALTADLAARGSQQPPQTHLAGRVILPGGLPLRNEPRSDAQPLGAPIPEGTEGSVGPRSGDWATFQFQDASGFRVGWVRWYYDRRIYLETGPK